MTDEPVTNCHALKPVRCGCGGEVKVLHPSFTHCIVVMCGKCGIKTPYMNSEAEAVQAWNRAMGERTAKAEWSEVDGCHLCGECGFAVCPNCDVYCAGCGARLEWE